MTDAAITRWKATGLSVADSRLIGSLDVRISDLPGDQLAASHGNFVVLDSTAGGNGWFVDSTPGDDTEFSSDGNGVLVATGTAAAVHIDALTVLMHEMGHALGQTDRSDSSASDLMSRSLPIGVRRLPTPIDDPLDANRDGQVSALDALVIINELSRQRDRFSGPEAGQAIVGSTSHVIDHYDTNRDGKVSALDALQIMNQLGRRPIVSAGEGEYGSRVDSVMPRIAPYSSLQSLLDDDDDDLLMMLAADNISAQLT